MLLINTDCSILEEWNRGRTKFYECRIGIGRNDPKPRHCGDALQRWPFTATFCRKEYRQMPSNGVSTRIITMLSYGSHGDSQRNDFQYWLALLRLSNFLFMRESSCLTSIPPGLPKVSD